MIKPADDQKRADIHAESKAVERALQESVREAMLEHKRLGLPAVEWRDGRVVWVPPEEIQIVPASRDDSQDAKSP
jgi:hypothetical protein